MIIIIIILRNLLSIIIIKKVHRNDTRSPKPRLNNSPITLAHTGMAWYGYDTGIYLLPSRNKFDTPIGTTKPPKPCPIGRGSKRGARASLYFNHPPTTKGEIPLRYSSTYHTTPTYTQTKPNQTNPSVEKEKRKKEKKGKEKHKERERREKERKRQQKMPIGIVTSTGRCAKTIRVRVPKELWNSHLRKVYPPPTTSSPPLPTNFLHVNERNTAPTPTTSCTTEQKPASRAIASRSCRDTLRPSGRRTSWRRLCRPCARGRRGRRCRVWRSGWPSGMLSVRIRF